MLQLLSLHFSHRRLLVYSLRLWFRLDGTIEITVPSNFFKFSPTKDLAPFSIQTPQKTYLKPIHYQFIVAGIIYYAKYSSQRRIFAGSAITVFAPATNPSHIRKKKFLGVNKGAHKY